MRYCLRLRVLAALAGAVLLASCARPSTRPMGPVAAGDRVACPMGPAGAVVPPQDRLLPLDAGARRWVDSMVASLSVRDKAAQLVVPWMSGRYVAVGSPEAERLRSWVQEAKVGGILTSIGPPVALADKLNRLQRQAEVPLLVATDMEHGPGQRLVGGLVLPWGLDLGGGTAFPPAMALGATGDPSLAAAMGRVTAEEARAVGIHLDFAPVVDVNNNPANPIINTRSYGSVPSAVAAFGAAQVRGLQAHGMLATAKHFPGHGDVSQDSHLVPLILRISAARADSVELVPFRAAIDAGVAAVMSAHIAFPALSGDSVLPATLSSRLLDSLLVKELGFRGLVVTDALNMGAIVQRYGAADAAVRALEAGADILLQPQDPFEVIDAVTRAVADGRVTEARLDRSVRKVLEAKARVGLNRCRTVDVAAVADHVGTPAHVALADSIATRAITLVRDRDGLVPMAPLRYRRVLALVYTDDPDPFPARRFLATLAPGVVDVDRVVLRPGTAAAVLDSLPSRAAASDLVLVVTDVGVRASKGSLALDSAVARRLEAVVRTAPTVLVTLGNPYVLRELPAVGTYLVGWGSDDASQRATARALLGQAPITGRLPIAIPPTQDVGDGLRRDTAALAAGAGLDAVTLDSLDRAIETAIAAGVTPGAAVAVGRIGGVARLRGYGRTDWAADAPVVTDSTLYDLASLTKVVGTTTALMLLVDRGRISLDAPLSRYLPAWPTGGWRDSVTIRRLLTHTAGLPAFVRFWHPSAGALRSQAAVVRAIAALEPAYRPGTRSVYSDLGFILLGATVEAVAGEPLDAFLAADVWRPLGMTDTGFTPTAGPTPLAPLARVAPTELDTVFRHTHVHGVVHDENAFAMGGVAGHAGLFSTARDLARFAHMLLQAGAADGTRLVRAATLARFVTASPGEERALGWDVAPGGGDIAASLAPSSFGHTGFTGTSLWVDPERGVYVVLLTNRVNPSRAQGGITPLRRTVNALAARAADRAADRGRR